MCSLDVYRPCAPRSLALESSPAHWRSIDAIISTERGTVTKSPSPNNAALRSVYECGSPGTDQAREADRKAKPSAAWPDSLREFLNDGSEPLAIRRSIPEKSAANQRALGRQAPCLNGRDRKYPNVELEWTSLAP